MVRLPPKLIAIFSHCVAILRAAFRDHHIPGMSEKWTTISPHHIRRETPTNMPWYPQTIPFKSYETPMKWTDGDTTSPVRPKIEVFTEFEREVTIFFIPPTTVNQVNCAGGPHWPSALPRSKHQSPAALAGWWALTKVLAEKQGWHGWAMKRTFKEISNRREFTNQHWDLWLMKMVPMNKLANYSLIFFIFFWDLTTNMRVWQQNNTEISLINDGSNPTNQLFEITIDYR